MPHPSKHVALPTNRGSDIRSHADIERLLYTTRGQKILSRVVANNTQLRRGADGISLWLHQTPIITWHRDNTVTLRTGGWYTMTTKERLNAWLPGAQWAYKPDRQSLQVESFRKKGASHWYIRTGYADPNVRWPTTELELEGWVPFYDGIQFDLVTCTIISGDHYAENDIQFNYEMDKKIKRWISKFATNYQERPYLEFVPAELTHEEAVAFFEQAFQNRQVPANFLLRVASDTGYEKPTQVAFMWEDAYGNENKWGTKAAESKMRAWLRSRLFRGAVSKSRAVRDRT